MVEAEYHLMTIFTSALDHPTAGERAAYLDAACADDKELRARVEALLRAHDHGASFLDMEATGEQAATEPDSAGPPAGGAGETLLRVQSPEPPGSIIGPYKLLQPIGEGGMGVVYMAEQTQPVKRLVALKLIKPGMDSRQVLSRFQAERQALALMDHPHIAKVLDAATTSEGRPYFVMELVKGVPITQFCDERRLSPRERLVLFIPVCQAVQHAHQKGIIHRDLKPSNVMVALYDGKPVPKVIDFGVAKAMGTRLTEATLYTGFGAIVGTPEYMSPEQAELNQLDIDTRSDIYSLGVLLYELLTGTTPIDRRRLNTAAILEVLRVIREVDPPRPSTRLSSMEQLPSVAANRNVEPRKLTGLVRGDLDWIVMKALEKNRSRRYETANGFAADIQRFLHDEPVTARPPSSSYRLRKFARRHRGQFVAGVALLVTLVAGIIGTTWGMIRADAARAEAQAEARRKEIALRAEQAALEVARLSKRDADEKLFASYRDQARASRLTRRPGQRFDSLYALEKATDLARTLRLPAATFDGLRDDVIASLALPDMDLDPTGPSLPWPADAFACDFDAEFSVYARTDRRGTCSVRRVADDVELHRFEGLGVPAWPVLSRNGRYLAVAHRTEGLPGLGIALHVWDLTKSPVRRIAELDAQRAVDFDAESHRLTASHEDGAVSVIDLPSGRLLHHLPPGELTREVTVAIHPNEPLVALASYFNPVVQVRDLRSGDVVARLPQDANPGSVAWHPDGHTLAVGLVEARAIRLYDRDSFGLVRTFRSESVVTVLTFNHAGDRIASTGWGSQFELFDVATGRKLFGSGRASMAMRFYREDRRLAAAVDDGRLRVYRLADGREFRALVRGDASADKELVFLHTVSPDGRIVAAATLNGFGLWDLEGGAELAFIPTGSHLNRVLFEHTGALLVLGPSGLNRWPLSGGDADGPWVLGPPDRLPLPHGDWLAQSRDGRVIATCSRAVGTTEPYAGGWILHADHPDRPIRVDPGADVSGILVSPDGAWVVTNTHNPTGLTKVWDARTGELVKQLPDRLGALPAFSPDGRWLSTDLDGGRLVEVGTWELGPRLGGTGRFAPDGRSMVIQDGAGRLRLVDTADGGVIATLADPHEMTVEPAFTPDGGLLIGQSAGEARGLRVWDLRRVRRQLAEMGLDWDEPAIPPAADPAPGPITIEVRGGPSHYDVGAALAAQRRLDEAAAELRLAIEADPRLAAAHDDLGSVLFDLKRVDEAIDHYRRSIELDSTRATAHNNLGYVLLTRGERDEAIACFRRAVDLAPGYVRAHDNLGNALRAHGKRDEAIAAYRRVAELEPRCAHHANLLAWLLVTRDPARSGDAAEALAHAGRAVELEPGKGSYWNTLGVARYRAGEWQSAIEALEKARTLQGETQLAHDAFFLAMSHHRLGHENEARVWLDRATDWMDRQAPVDEELKRFHAEAEQLIKGELQPERREATVTRD